MSLEFLEPEPMNNLVFDVRERDIKPPGMITFKISQDIYGEIKMLMRRIGSRNIQEFFGDCGGLTEDIIAENYKGCDLVFRHKTIEKEVPLVNSVDFILPSNYMSSTEDGQEIRLILPMSWFSDDTAKDFINSESRCNFAINSIKYFMLFVKNLDRLGEDYNLVKVDRKTGEIDVQAIPSLEKLRETRPHQNKKSVPANPGLRLVERREPL